MLTWCLPACLPACFYKQNPEADHFYPFSAEFRGPGVHHNYEESGNRYDSDAEKQGRGFGIGGSRGRIIFLGDGTEVLTDSDDTEMFDDVDEDEDLESQVSKKDSTSTDNETGFYPFTFNSSTSKPGDTTATGSKQPTESRNTETGTAAITEQRENKNGSQPETANADDRMQE